MAAQEPTADRGEVVGEPGDRVERMAHGIRPAPFSDLVSIDCRNAARRAEVNAAQPVTGSPSTAPSFQQLSAMSSSGYCGNTL